MSQRRARSIAKELGQAQLGDVRLSRRLESLTQSLMDAPGASLPKAVGSEAALEGAYRILGHDDVSAALVLAPHVRATAERVVATQVAYAISDTTELRFGGDSREGLGPLQGGGRGFLAHVCLAVAADRSKTPLGILSHETWVRSEKKKGRHGTTKSRRDPDRESLKWNRGVEKAEEAVAGRAELIHVMDREADIYHLLAMLREKGCRFIIRVAQDRLVGGGDEPARLFASMKTAQAVCARDVELSRRQRKTKGHPKRDARVTELSIAARPITLRRPDSADLTLPRELELNAVRAFERAPPEGEESVDWMLVTSEPITSIQQMESVVDGYRIRWVIEELFKALKTGCGIEKSQLESLDALLNLLAIQLPVAAQLLALRSLARDSQARALDVLSPTQLEALRVMSSPLPANPSAMDVLAAIARLGAHIKNNGPPGWQVLGRGLADLLKYEAALIAFKRTNVCDQS